MHTLVGTRVRLFSPRWQASLNTCITSLGLRRRGGRDRERGREWEGEREGGGARGEMERESSKEMPHAYEADAGV